MKPAIVPILIVVLLAACQPGEGAGVPGDAADHAPFSGIAEDETIRFAGTEPFWSGDAKGDRLTYITPESPGGRIIAIDRFSGRGGISLSGLLGGTRFDMSVTPGQCSDGMSDRSYPFVATLQIGSEIRNGCAWTQRKGFVGEEKP